ncbi:MAG: hypothetical protein WC584_03095 [Candidatus Pacearchaeota archaeon]
MLSLKDKRANAWINILVILVLATCAVAGYTFLTSSNKIVAEISGVSVLNNVYLEENNFNFYVREAGEKAVEETYKQLQEDDFPTPDSFFSNFQKQFEIYGLDILKKDYLKKENFKIDSSKNVLKVKIDNREIQENLKTKENNLEVLYREELNFEFKLK